MKILVVYASTEGQTRKICRFAADRLTDAGHSVELLAAEAADGIDPGRFDAAILAGSVHAGLLQDSLLAFGNAQGRLLSAMPTLYLQVSLSAAGDDADEWDDLRAIAERVATRFGWTPQRTEHVAGAFRFAQYDFFKGWAMRWIAAQKGERVDARSDREYTDWDALGAVLDDWAEAARAKTSRGGAAQTG